MITATHYSARRSAANKAFADSWHAAYGRDKDPNFFAVAAWDGMALIYDVVKQLDGKIDGDKAMAAIKNWKHDSPRGPISIDPETRDIVQNIYICRSRRRAGACQHRHRDLRSGQRPLERAQQVAAVDRKS